MSNKLDIAFLAGLFPKETESEIINNSIGSIQNAANALQWNFVDGLDKNNNKIVKIINSLYIGSYPTRYKKSIVKTYQFSHCSGAEDINVGFLNFIGLKHFFRYWSLKPYLKKWAKDKNENKAIIAYALTNTFVSCLKYIKKINPNIITCIIVPDLPQYMNTTTKTSFVYKYLKNIDSKLIKENLKYIDGFVLLTEQMNDVLCVKNYTVIEGIATNVFSSNNYVGTKLNTDVKTILYTGTLNEKYGILNLLYAFKQILNSNYKLIICGVGDSEEKIVEAMKEDNRIIFKGQISRQEVLDLQLQATVVINPRQNTEEFTKYSFPSKNLEYLSSGTPLIAYKLDGIPNEYDDYIYYVEDNSLETLKNKIIEICETPQEELNKFAENAREFVLKEKNNVVQAKKIIDLIGEKIRE